MLPYYISFNGLIEEEETFCKSSYYNSKQWRQKKLCHTLVRSIFFHKVSLAQVIV